MIMKRHLLILTAGVLLVSGPASAGDFFCKNADGTLKIQTYTLTGVPGGGEDGWFSFAAQKAAAILGTAGSSESAGEKALLTGTVTPVPDRVGGNENFSLTDAEGNPVHLKTVRGFLPVNCGRADCQWVETVTGTLIFDGTAHALQCNKTFF